MEQVIEDFILALRSFGVRVSTSESIDAFRAVEIIDYKDREILKASLSAVLAKTPAEKESFNECFDRFFSLADFSDGGIDTLEGSYEDIQQGVSPLTGMLISGNRVGLMTSMMKSARELDIHLLNTSQ